MAESDFWQALSDTIHRSVNLRIVTLVGDAGVTGTLERMEIAAPTASAGTLVTDINLVAGDITRIISERMLATEFTDLRSAHEASVTQAQDIVERNVKILITIVKELGQQLEALPPPTPGPVRSTGN
jgi:hypothetical protein